MTANEKISLMIIEAVKAGADVADAVDAVLGAGTYEAIASDVYEALRVQ